jgi:hypothetical protein
MSARPDDAPMSSAERTALRSLIGKRARVEKAKVEAYVKTLVANGDAELERTFSIEDMHITEIFEQTQVKVDQLKAVMNAQLDALGVSKELRPSLSFYMDRGGYRDRDHRSELRRKVRVEAEAAGKRWAADIEAWELGALEELARTTMTSAAAHGVLDRLPEATDTLPAVVNLIGTVETQPVAAIESSREAKHLAIVGALTIDGSRSDREIGRLLGFDHKTVAKVRQQRGEIPSASEDFPTEDGEIA